MEIEIKRCSWLDGGAATSSSSSQFFSFCLCLLVFIYCGGPLRCGFVPLKIEFHCLRHAFSNWSIFHYTSSSFFAAKWNYIAVLAPCANSFVTFLSNRVEMKFSSQHFLPIFNIS
jgi:hypothetical protein